VSVTNHEASQEHTAALSITAFIELQSVMLSVTRVGTLIVATIYLQLIQN